MNERQRLGLLWANKEAKRVLLMSFNLGLASSFVYPFLSLFGTQEVGLSPLRFAWFMTSVGVVAVVVSTWLSRWSDVRWSRRSVLLLGAAGGALGYGGYALLRNYWALLVDGCLFVSVSTVAFSQLFAVARDTFETGGTSKRDMPFYMNLVRLSFAAAWTVGPAIASFILQATSFRIAFLAAAALYVLFGTLAWTLLPARPPRSESILSAQSLPLRRALTQPIVFVHFLGFCIYQATATMGMMNLPLFITQEIAGTRTDIGIAYGVAPVFEIPFMFYVGILAGRIAHAKIIRGALLVALAYYGGLSLCQSSASVFVLQILGAFVVAVMTGLAITFFQDFMPGQPGTATNLYSSASRIGSTVGFLSFGTFAQGYGYRAVFFACATAIACAFVLLVVAAPKVPATSFSIEP